MTNKDYLIFESATFSAPRNIRKTPLGTVCFEQVLQESDRQNQNRRTYPKSVLSSAMDNERFKRTMRTGNLFGEAGHPTEKDIAVQAQVNPMKLAFKVKNIWWEGNLLMGECETANTAIGKDMAGVIEQGTQVGVSLRAQGDVTPTAGGSIVKPGLNIVTWDWVMSPSHDKAYMRETNGVDTSMTEGFMCESFLLESHTEEALNLQEGLLSTEGIEDSKIIYESFVDNGDGEMVHVNKLYFYDNEDKIMLETYSNSTGNVKLQNGNTIKTVQLEDHLIKNIRDNMLKETFSIDSNKRYSSTLKK